MLLFCVLQVHSGLANTLRMKITLVVLSLILFCSPFMFFASINLTYLPTHQSNLTPFKCFIQHLKFFSWEVQVKYQSYCYKDKSPHNLLFTELSTNNFPSEFSYSSASTFGAYSDIPTTGCLPLINFHSYLKIKITNNLRKIKK